MNSKNLQKQFPKIYQEFFFACQRVCSAPHSFFWVGDFSGFYGGLTISSKLPLRFYVGLEQIEPDGFEIEEEFFAYFPSQQKFKKIRLDSFIKKQLTNILKNQLKGYRVRFLSELSLGLSLGGLGAISAALSDLIFPDVKFSQKFDLAKKIAVQIQTGRTSPATAYCALVGSPYPCIFYQSGAKWWGKSLDELIELPPDPVWPFDFGLIFSGNLVQGAAVISSAEEVKKVASEREREVAKITGRTSLSFWSNYLEMLDQISSQSLLALVNIFKSGANERNIRKFFESLNQYQNMLHFLEISTSNIDRIYSMIHRLSDKLENAVGSGAKITGVGKGGEVLFAMPYGQYREKIKLQINKLNNLDISLDYASWSDEIESNGVRLEQDLEQEKFFSASPAKLLLKIYDGNQISTKFLENIEDAKADLLLDLTSGKIFYENKSVNSKDLPSQKATCEILGKLLESPSKLANTELGKYSKSRYDLQGKITSPLLKLTGLRFEITGGVYDNYTLSLKPFDLKIAVVSSVSV